MITAKSPTAWVIEWDLGESEHSMLIVAWFISELPGKSVFAKQLS